MDLIFLKSLARDNLRLGILSSLTREEEKQNAVVFVPLSANFDAVKKNTRSQVMYLITLLDHWAQTAVDKN